MSIKKYDESRKKDFHKKLAICGVIFLIGIALGVGMFCFLSPDEEKETITTMDTTDKRDIVEIGGEVRLSGARDDAGNLWNVGIGVPLKDSRANALALELSNYSIATSGDYRNFREEDGHIFSHTISPQTGKPLKNELASVTVFSHKCADADAYATAIMTMGAKAGLKFANRRKLPVIMFLHSPDGDYTMMTSARAQELIGVESNAAN